MVSPGCQGRREAPRGQCATSQVDVPFVCHFTVPPARSQDAERRHKKRFLKKQKDEAEKTVSKSHRDRLDELNEKLASLTEHNDIPRISAAGNG